MGGMGDPGRACLATHRQQRYSAARRRPASVDTRVCQSEKLSRHRPVRAAITVMYGVRE